MSDRSQTVHQAIILLCNVGGVKPAEARQHMEMYLRDLRLELDHALDTRDSAKAKMVQDDMAKCQGIMDALLCAYIEG